MNRYASYMRIPFSWIEEIPSEWSIIPAHRVFSEVKTKNEDGSIVNALQFKFGKIIPKKNFEADTDHYVAETITTYTIVEPNTIIINGLNLNYDLKSLRVGIVEEKGVITSAYLALKPDTGKINPFYANYLLKGYETRMAFHNMGVGLRLTLGFKEFKNQPIILPDMGIQEKIVSFLDQKIAHIDNIIAETRDSIEQYKAWKTSIIYEAVTKGLDMNVEMKDSGVEGPAVIPSSWEITRLKFLTTDIVDCPHETPEYKSDGKYYVIRTADQDFGRLRSDENMYRLDEAQYKNRIRRLSLNRDDIVYGREGERWGLACLVPENDKYCLGQRMLQFRCDVRIFYPKFAVYALLSPEVRRQGEYDVLGSTSPHVNIATVLNYSIPIPKSIDEQKKIAQYLDLKCKEIDALIAEKESLLLDLEAFKKSLIFEVVTGKRKVI